MSQEAYPLQWPKGWPRTQNRRAARFKLGTRQAKAYLLGEVKAMKGSRPVISTNIRLGSDGFFDGSESQPGDTGVAVYFNLKGKPMVFACGAWNRVQDNLIAIFHTVEALRGIERWGASDMLERAFTGFAALPEPVAEEHWTGVRGLPETAPIASIERRYRDLMKTSHPDTPTGSNGKAQRLNKAIAGARAAKGFT